MLELRVGALLVTAAYLFYGDGLILSSININIPYAFGYHNYSRSPRHAADLMLACLVAGSVLFGLQTLLFESVTTRFIPLLTLSTIIGIILSQQRLRRVLKRIALGGISAENRLGDILVSDALVSMAGVFVDLAYAVSLTYYHVPATASLDRTSQIGQKILLIACIPQGIRMKQCVVDYRRTKNKQHLLNLLKYFIGNMPHALRSNIAALNPEIPEENSMRDMLTGFLMKSLYVNAVYSLAWDVLVDWNLARLQNSTTASSLRFNRHVYYAAALTDTVLRFAFLAARPDERVIFILQLLELARRGMWIVFRVESEPPELTDEIELAPVEA